MNWTFKINSVLPQYLVSVFCDANRIFAWIRMTWESFALFPSNQMKFGLLAIKKDKIRPI